ncbi:NUDIX hydrolase [Actinomadura darangshiensis]|uniref:NUDIX hydrolase n=1 Tax=Actinomadura darangshiensis TaxID=705336 RepID=A0A4V2YX36_9ACTN|nr:NUDIX hydrolase [Actinomadura darangshiensis]TDD87947.1 NUDIX hydrolase [Actinomadura darangshiensis]
MDAELARDDNGDALTGFYRVAEEDRPGDAPLTAALVAVWHDDRRLLLVFNRYRQCWELPGGMIDPGETPRQAAVRELREEAGIHVENPAFVGYARFELGTEQRTEYAALYTAPATPPDDRFTPNEEITAICWWDGVQPLTGRLHRLDAILGRLTKDTA